MKKNSKLINGIALILALFAHSSFARKGTYGPEFTFSHFWKLRGETFYYGDPTPNRDRFWTQIKKQMNQFCATADCTAIYPPKRPSLTVQFKDGYYFTIKNDQNVFEVTAQPQTLAEIKANEERLQKAVFDNFKAIGLTPNSLYGSGHINLGLESHFNGDVKTLTAFIADFFNHPGLAYGALDIDPYNAYVFQDLPISQKNAFAKICEDVQAYRTVEMMSFVRRMKNEVYRGLYSKNCSINLENDRPTLEIRSIRSQKNAHEYTLLVELFEKRIELIRKRLANGEKITALTNVGTRNLRQIVSQFYAYIQETGLDITPYRTLLPTALRLVKPYPAGSADTYQSDSHCSALLKEKIRNRFLDPVQKK